MRRLTPLAPRPLPPAGLAPAEEESDSAPAAPNGDGGGGGGKLQRGEAARQLRARLGMSR
jgi:hypothetical protein